MTMALCDGKNKYRVQHIELFFDNLMRRTTRLIARLIHCKSTSVFPGLDRESSLVHDFQRREKSGDDLIVVRHLHPLALP